MSGEGEVHNVHFKRESDWVCAMCRNKYTTLPWSHYPWGCTCGTHHLLCYGCLEEIGEVWLEDPRHLTLEFCPVSEGYELARALMEPAE